MALLTSASTVAAAPVQDTPKAAATELAAGFANPPGAARPRAFWFWMNGNVTQDGIAKDLEWMSRIGLGGVLTFDAALATPQIVPQRLVYMTPEWKEAFRFAVATADRLGMDFTIAGSPGWSHSGGPWVPPEDGMKKLVWSETVLEGGRRFQGRLPDPPTVSGPYQTIPKDTSLDIKLGGPEHKLPTAYGDTAIVAYRMTGAAALAPGRVHTGDGQDIDPKLVGDPVGPGVTVARGTPDAPGSIVIEYEMPQTVRSASVYLPGSRLRFMPSTVAPALEAQVAGGGWRKVADVETDPVPTTVSFAPVTARRFRLVLPAAPPPGLGIYTPIKLPGVVWPPVGLDWTGPVKISLFQLSAESRVNRFETKAGFSLTDDYYGLDAWTGPAVAGVPPESVIDLTDRVAADGRLDWTPPPGRWKVLRLGWSLQGTLNHPATPEATGLEVDKYDGAAVRRYNETYLGMYARVTGPELTGRRGLRAQENDSTEVGPSNWTPAILAQFQRLRGYDPRPWLPALTGVIVGSRGQSDAFLYDFRRTLAELLAREHYGTIAEVVRAHGMVHYAQAIEGERWVLGDDMAMRRYADIPMGALWAYDPDVGPSPICLVDLKGAASVAHVYGQNLASAESMTAYNAPWAFAPADLKRYIDLEFASGINLPVIHTSAHQPVDDKVPGLSNDVYGQHFTRHETWAEMARPWIDYIARSDYLLQQGRNVADVAYFYGEEAPLVSLYRSAPPADAPVHYAYDFVNAEVVLKELAIDGDELTTRGGARYRTLYLGGSSRRMTLPLLRRLAELASAGATIVGPAPENSPSLMDDKAEFDALVKRLWGDEAVTPVGRGKVVASRDVEAALHADGLQPDFSHAGAGPDSQILFVHRRLADGDIYFVNNRKARPERVEARFRVTGKAPEIWRADTGTMTPASFRIDGGETVVPLELAAEDALFVVFRKSTAAPSYIAPALATWSQIAVVSGPWELAFQPGRGAPAGARLAELVSLSENTDPAIKYFSGTTTYRTSFTLPSAVTPGVPLMLDLGKVSDVAEVAVNGKPVGYAWKAPYRIDVGEAIQRGRNTLEVKVANLWVNRLIGDAQPGAKKVTYTTVPTYQADAPLRQSGLLGPVTLLGR